MPLVHDGVLFVHGMGDRVQALDATDRRPALGISSSASAGRRRRPSSAAWRSIAIALYIGTSDANVIALDAKTGKIVWDTRIGDTRVREGVAGGVLAARGKVMVGTTGTGVGAKPGGPQIVGLDADTGTNRLAGQHHRTAWEPGGDSWNGIPVDRRSGASVWTTGSYEPTTGLAFFGTGNTYDTGPLISVDQQAGHHQRRALYTNTTLAIDPDTGKVVWHFQHHPNELWDLDWAFERQVVELPVRGQMRKLVVTAGKIGIYDAVEAATGRFVFSIDLGLQNIVTAIDPETGKKSIDASRIPGATRR